MELDRSGTSKGGEKAEVVAFSPCTLLKTTSSLHNRSGINLKKLYVLVKYLNMIDLLTKSLTHTHTHAEVRQQPGRDYETS